MKLIKPVLYLLLVYVAAVSCLVMFQESLVFKPPYEYGSESPASHKLQFEEIKIQSVPSNQNINAWWLPQLKTDAAGQPVLDEAKPAILYLHGNGANLPKLAHVAPIFYNYGWSTLMIDYRGYGKSDKPDGGLSEGSLTDDALSAMNWLESKGYSRSKIIIWGHSLGSAVATNVALKQPPAALILEGALNSIYKMARFRYWFFPILPFMVKDDFDTSAKIAHVKCPILSLHADLDLIVPYDKGVEVFNLANEPKKFIKLHGIDHNDFPDVQAEYRSEILSFVNQYLK